MGLFNEIDALKDDALEPFQNEPGKRRFVQIVFVLLCAAVGAGMAWLMAKLDLPPWSSFGYALAIVLLFIFAAIWTIARSSQNYRRFHWYSCPERVRGLCLISVAAIFNCRCDSCSGSPNPLHLRIPSMADVWSDKLSQ